MPNPLFGVLYQSWPQPDGSFRLEFLSADAERLLEATADEFAARWLDRTLPLFGVDADEFYRNFAESDSQHIPRQAEFGYIGPKSGAIHWFRAHDFPRRTPEGAPFFSGVLIDITELKQNHRQCAALDHELRDGRHMESPGLLAGGIAHDFNNLLAIILGNAGVAKMLAGQGSPIDKNLREIETACERAADLCNRITAGTTVELLLLLKADPVGIGPVDLLPGAADSAHCKILVVDDDANIRELICSVLEDDGYTVLAAANGQDAESLFGGDPHGFRLAVVDLTMPGIGGHELIRRMRLKVDGFPVLVVSGYADREMPRDLPDSGPTVVLPKPFRLEQLSAAVKRLTSEARPA